MQSIRKKWLNLTSAALVSGVLLMAMLVSGFTPSQVKRGPNWGKPNWGGSAQLKQIALKAGYDEGIKEGRNDRQRNERFGFTDESDYKSATEGYNSKLGKKALYQRYFRMGFENGYRDGWNGY